MYNDSLYHYGVKGMKGGVRKYQSASKNLDEKKAAYKQANKEYKKSFNKAYNRAIAGWSPVKKHRQNNDARWEDAAAKADKANKAKADYKAAKKEFNKNTTVGQKVGRALSSNGAKATGKALGKIGKVYLTDQIVTGGAGARAAKSALTFIGRASITAVVMARGGSDIKWYDKQGRRVG